MAFSGRQFFKNSDRGDWQSATDALETGFFFGFYGSFSDSTTQTISANTATVVTFDTVEESYGVTIGSPTSRIVIANPGTYNIQFSAQIEKPTASAEEATLWLRVGGVDVPRSAGDVTLSGSGAFAIASWNYVYTFTANQYLELVWSSASSSMRLLAHPPRTAPVRPAVPSIILTATQVGAVR